ncbi:MAG TPA: NAD-dependent epimerase/dehydratase family protein [Acidimicrobiia bacterium]|nr:NAD-dependent epimerase/dehydratase family protein [Acidimicrobiia bacterium]
MKRVLVTGMGGHLGTRAAQLLEQRDDVEAIVGCDFMPPRRRLRRAIFKRIEPRDRDRLVTFVTEFAPTAVVHFGVYEPAARMGLHRAQVSTEACTVAALGAAARTGMLEHIVLRSGLEVYGRGRGTPLTPDEDAPLDPTSPYGMSLLEVETTAAGIARRHDVRVASLRFAPVSGSHAPSPLGRLLRLPLVPVPAFVDPPFQLLDTEDAARAAVEALVRGAHGPYNVVGPGAASPWQAVRLGGRVPLPVSGPGWLLARRLSEVAGAPIPPHTLALMRQGLTADGGHATSALGLGAMVPTQVVLDDLFEWATVTPIARAERRVA